LDKKRGERVVERVVERGRVAVGWERDGHNRLLRKGPSCPSRSKVHGMRQYPLVRMALETWPVGILLRLRLVLACLVMLNNRERVRRDRLWQLEGGEEVEEWGASAEMEVKLRRRWAPGRAVEPATSRIPTSVRRIEGCPGRRPVGSYATSE
jgi:hypothetical protein